MGLEVGSLSLKI
ncbi:BnaA08g11920D [Brassica napus]|uniref:BnaA08g11920D protein n=3 Tax=Brassica TaxID=3705 RepID=A0A078I4U1_BRANA|nr:BnaA08g11920D [Brassica napus]